MILIVSALSLSVNTNDYQNPSPGGPDPDPAIFPIILPVIQINQHRTVKNFGSYTKIKAVFLNIKAILLLIPLEVHRIIVLTNRKYVKKCSFKKIEGR